MPHNVNDTSPTSTLDEKEKELTRPNPEKTTQEASHISAIIVDWDGPDDPSNPKNWAFRRKWAATVIVSAFTFISPISSSMVAPATLQIAGEFGVTSTAIIAMMTSVFVLGYAVGPLFLGPLSEIFGRSRVLQLSNLWYLVWNLGCGFTQNKDQLIAFRLLAGLGGSAPLAIGGGVIGDVWHPEERGKAISIYSLAPLLGPVVGPVCGAWIAERSTWRWVFWSTSIVDAIIQVFGIFFLQESRLIRSSPTHIFSYYYITAFAPLLLARKAAAIKKSIDPEKAQTTNIYTIFETSGERRSVVI
ncbi:hypothetical protein C0992_006077 [Termitomyces sp. T32_za158]|nr:hypothetical protein C0992_006077 [Termitomyces sp. T32_za158]